ncbi:MAG: hypothetical protein HYW07_04810 [Candidatus Latescibacteria bacterium]|nr:hypothetical protein [Candidatus Latescibacterota bacterium]
MPAQTDKEFEEWQQKDQQDFQQFKDENDRAFLEFLQKDWREWQGFQGIVPDKIPKPVELPVAAIPPPAPIPPRVEEKPAPAPPPPPAEPEVPPVPEVPTPEVKPPPAGVPQEQGEFEILEFSFFGMNWRMSYGVALKAGLGESLDKDSISAFWKALSLAPYEDCLRQAQEIRARTDLNDWGYYQLLQQIGSGLYEGEQNQAILFVWFMLCKSGYQAKVGYDQDRVYLLLPAEQTLYNTSYFTFGDNRFYEVAAASGKAPNLYTYDGNYPGADKGLDLRVGRPPRIGRDTLAKTLKFTFEGQEYQVPVQLERGAVDFYAHYPQTEFKVYFDASPSPEAQTSLVQSLKPTVAGKTEAEAVNLLLCFVQTAFGYQVDDQQFGREKFLFLEETLFYPASDCEDRSILFAYLVRELLGLEVIGLDYPGHVATAVRFSEEVPGDFVLCQGRKFMVCDPTYINATLGMVMPQFKGVDPQVILVRL